MVVAGRASIDGSGEASCSSFLYLPPDPDAKSTSALPPDPCGSIDDIKKRAKGRNEKLKSREGKEQKRQEERERKNNDNGQGPIRVLHFRKSFASKYR